MGDEYSGGVAMDPRGQFVVVSGFGGTVSICPLDGSDPKALESLDPTVMMGGVAYDPERQLVAAGVIKGAAKQKVLGVWNLRDGSLTLLGPTPDAADGFEGAFALPAFLPDGSLLTVQRGRGIRKWNLGDGSSELIFANEDLHGGKISPDGRKVVMTGFDRSDGLLSFDIASGEAKPLEHFHGRFDSVVFSPLGDVVAASAWGSFSWCGSSPSDPKEEISDPDASWTTTLPAPL